MSKVFIEESTLTSIGNAIRDKTGGTDLIAPLNMPTEINGISTGTTLPEEAFNITGDCSYKFANNGWNWFINNYGSQVTTNNITNCNNMFHGSDSLEQIPFSINNNAIPATDMSYMFSLCHNLLSLPAIVTSNVLAMANTFSYCYKIREIPESYTTSINFGTGHDSSSAYFQGLFSNCYSLRKIPSEFLKQCYGKATYTGFLLYYLGFVNCWCIDKIVGIPVQVGPIKSNAFSNTFNNCHRAKNIIFDTNEDGTAKTAQWKGQTINLQTEGYVTSSPQNTILYYNSGITADKEVTDDATYAALKNDPDWFTCNSAYSRYNKTSAIATINSLPDTSAYIAANGGTNTIKFTGTAGSATDGGAINTMTEEQIAVATAKGWTVTFA